MKRKWGQKILALLLVCTLCLAAAPAAGAAYEDYLPKVEGFEQTEWLVGSSTYHFALVRIGRPNSKDVPDGLSARVAFGDDLEYLCTNNLATTAETLTPASREFVESCGPLVDRAAVGDQITVKLRELVIQWDIARPTGQQLGGILAERDSGYQVVITVDEEVQIPAGLTAHEAGTYLSATQWEAELGSGYDTGTYMLQAGTGTHRLFWTADIANTNQPLVFRQSGYRDFTGDLSGDDVTLRRVQYDHISDDGKTLYLNISRVSAAADPGDQPSDWARAEVSRAREQGLIPAELDSRYQSNITRAEFCHLAAAWLESVTGQTLDGLLSAIGLEPISFSDTNDTIVAAMSALGVVNGVGNGQFHPAAEITREEAAVMLWRLARQAGGLTPNCGEVQFADQDLISSWAEEAVAVVAACEADGSRIMNGTGGNRFSPQGTYTREQSILTMLRLYLYLNEAG